MNFYRYEICENAIIGLDGEAEIPKFPNPTLSLLVFNLYKETPKGYHIGYGGGPGQLKSPAKWVSKTAKKRYAYPSKEEALHNFIKRKERRALILRRQLLSAEIAINLAKQTML